MVSQPLAEPEKLQDLIENDCPLPPYRSWVKPKSRTAMASHPRSGSTWARFLLERASGQACGFEDPGWANVLPHVGGVEGKPDDINQEGLIIKTHSICYGCWSDAPLFKRLRVRNTSLDPVEAQKLIGAPAVAAKLEHDGCCLIFPPGTLETMLKARSPWSPIKKQATPMHCLKMYDRAIVLIRDPLDVFRSNYHYRTKVLGMQRGLSWTKDDHFFARERAEAYMNFYRSWHDFAQVRPALLVYYELLKLHPAQEVHRILQFLDVKVTQAKLQCAVEESTMGKLKDTNGRTNGRVDAATFFGSRGITEQKENLSYPPSLLRNFDRIGLFHFAYSMGYITYQGGVTAARDLALGNRSSEIQVVNQGPWKEVLNTTEAAAATLSSSEAPWRQASASRLQWGFGTTDRWDVSPMQSAMAGLLVGLLCGMYLCRRYQSLATKEARSR